MWASQMALVVKNPPASAGHVRDVGSIPWSERSPEGGHGSPLQYSCLENPVDRGVWQATVYRITKVRHDWIDLARMQGLSSFLIFLKTLILMFVDILFFFFLYCMMSSSLSLSVVSSKDCLFLYMNFSLWLVLLLWSTGSRVCVLYLQWVSSVVVVCGLWSLGSVLVAHKLSCLRLVESSHTRDCTCIPCIGRQTSNAWTTREIWYSWFLISFLFHWYQTFFSYWIG